MVNSLRIHSAPAPAPASLVPPAPKAPDEYLTRLVKLIPAEIIALYLSIKGTFGAHTEALRIWGLVCLVLVILVRAIATKSNQSIQGLAVLVAAISFILWVSAGGNQIGWGADWFSWLTYPEAVVGVWTFLVPYIYKGDSK